MSNPPPAPDFAPDDGQPFEPAAAEMSKKPDPAAQEDEQRTSGLFGLFIRNEAPRMGRGHAVIQGTAAAVWRVLLSFALLPACLFLILFYERGAQQISPALNLRDENRFHGDGGFALVLWSTAAGCAIGTLWVMWTSPDHKWRILNWLYFGIVAAGTLSCYGALILFIAILGAQFAVHYLIHLALRKSEREWRQNRATQRIERPVSPELLTKYGGVAGFHTDDTGGQDPDL